MVQAYLNVYSRIITQAVFFRNPLTMLRFGLYNTQRYKTRKAVTKTVETSGNAQRTGEGVSPVKVQDFSKITSEPRAEEEFLLYYIGRRK